MNGYQFPRAQHTAGSRHACVRMPLPLRASRGLRIAHTISSYIPQKDQQWQWRNLHQHPHLRVQTDGATIPAHRDRTSFPTVRKQAPLRPAGRSNHSGQTQHRRRPALKWLRHLWQPLGGPMRLAGWTELRGFTNTTGSYEPGCKQKRAT